MSHPSWKISLFLCSQYVCNLYWFVPSSLSLWIKHPEDRNCVCMLTVTFLSPDTWYGVGEANRRWLNTWRVVCPLQLTTFTPNKWNHLELLPSFGHNHLPESCDSKSWSPLWCYREAEESLRDEVGYDVFQSPGCVPAGQCGPASSFLLPAHALPSSSAVTDPKQWATDHGLEPQNREPK